MGENIRASSLIVIADVSTQMTPKFRQFVAVREILKGHSNVDEILEIPASGSAPLILPRIGRNVAVLFTPDWKNSSSPIREVYTQPGQIAVLRELLRIYALPGERPQLEALREKALGGDPLFGEQVVADIARMREPQNFEVALSSFDGLDTASQSSLLELFGRIGDNRAVPLLVKELQSTEPKVRWMAAHTLQFRFPGAPGVTEAFVRLSENPAMLDLALPYLSVHAPAVAAKFPRPEPTLWQQAQQQLKDGNSKAAQETLFALVEREPADDNPSLWSNLDAARILLPLLDANEKTRLRKLLVALLANHTNSYGDAEVGIELLRELQDEENLPALLKLLHDPNETTYSAWDGASRKAAFAIADLNSSSRQAAANRVLEKMKKRLAPEVQQRLGEGNLYLFQLVWLADDATWTAATKDFLREHSAQAKEIQPIRDAVDSGREAASLAELLAKDPNQWQNDARQWIIGRLAYLRDPIAVPSLISHLNRTGFAANIDESKAALIAIGGPQVENATLELLRHENMEARRLGMDILYALHGEKVRPLLRRILTEEDLGERTQAIFLLGYVGVPEDLALLQPLADFWKNERFVQTQASDAIAGIRNRFRLPVSGPPVAN